MCFQGRIVARITAYEGAPTFVQGAERLRPHSLPQVADALDKLVQMGICTRKTFPNAMQMFKVAPLLSVLHSRSCRGPWRGADRGRMVALAGGQP